MTKPDDIPIKARPTTYDGIKMRSRLEARVAAYLDRCGWPWEYEPRAFATRGGQYLPDFVISGFGRRTKYLEVKGAHPDQAGFSAILSRMSVVRSSDPEAALMFCSDGMLSTGRFAVSYPYLDGWIEAIMMACPDHPDRVSLHHVYADERIAPWCQECDPDRAVRVVAWEAMDHAIGAAWTSQ